MTPADIPAYMAHVGLAARTAATRMAAASTAAKNAALTDLARRLRENLELAVPNQKTFYGGGAEGYTDYPLAP